MDISTLNFGMQKLTNGAGEFRIDCLRFVRDLFMKINSHFFDWIKLTLSCGTSTSLSGSPPFEPANIRMKVVLPVPFSPSSTKIWDSTKWPASTVSSNFPAFYVDTLMTNSNINQYYLDHFGVLMTETMFQLALISILGHFKGKSLITEFHILSWNETIQENVDSFAHWEGHSDDTVDT